MNLETKVGAFVVSGLLLIGTAIFLLGDYTLEKRYVVNVLFHDVSNLNKNAPVKLSGVEVGQVKDIVLVDSSAKVVLSVRQGVHLYKDAVFEIGSTGIIGSKYLQITQGHRAAGVISPDSTVVGIDPTDIQQALSKTLASLQTMLDQLNAPGPRGTLVGNLRDTVANVRELTANLNDLIAQTKPRMTSTLDRVDDITAKLDKIMAKADKMMTALSTDKGTVGALLHDQKMKKDVEQTVASVRKAADTAQDMLSRINQFKVYWNYDWRYESAIRTSRSDIGLYIYPRDHRYYYIGGSNLANVSDAKRGGDFVQPNRVDALLGFDHGPFDLAFGILRSAGGGRLTVTPFYADPFWKRFSVVAQAYDFGRDRVVNGRLFDKPAYDVGVLARVTKWLGLGARVEDLAETKRGQIWANIKFEDQDISYLFGLASFGAAGTRGRSKSSSP
ncbi:MAG: MCE family protein [Elusimicrobia bacterium]|nr:MCE family protein [Elusimicrobiota bacterium]MDE2424568.1 MCE family protein [Elusimicrobiota bacterium]